MQNCLSRSFIKNTFLEGCGAPSCFNISFSALRWSIVKSHRLSRNLVSNPMSRCCRELIDVEIGTKHLSLAFSSSLPLTLRKDVGLPYQMRVFIGIILGIMKNCISIQLKFPPQLFCPLCWGSPIRKIPLAYPHRHHWNKRSRQISNLLLFIVLRRLVLCVCNCKLIRTENVDCALWKKVLTIFHFH